MVATPMEKNIGNKKRSNDISAGSRVPHQLPFKTYLELIRCPPQMNKGRYLSFQNHDCQVCINRKGPITHFLHLKIRLNFLYLLHLILKFTGSYKPCRLKSMVFQANPKFIQSQLAQNHYQLWCLGRKRDLSSISQNKSHPHGSHW